MRFTKLVATLALLAPLGCGSGAQSTQVQTPPPTVAEPAPSSFTPVESVPTMPVTPKEDTTVAYAPPEPKVEPPPPPAADPPTAPLPTPATAKPLSKSVERGLTWLATQSVKGGGWDQGDEATKIRGGEQKPGTANVADTSMALLAFIRAGHTPNAGEHKQVVERGLNFVMQQIEESDSDSLYVTSVRGTRVQSKIGQFVDTFSALMVLTEAKGKMKNPADNARLEAAMKKVVKKIEKNQKDNGGFDDKGWAPVLSQALAAKGMNRAVQGGAQVSKQVLQRFEQQAATGSMKAAASAGVTLYGDSSSSANVRDDATTKRANAEALKEKAAKPQKRRPEPMAQSPDKPPTAAEIAAAEAEAVSAEKAAIAQEKALVAKLGDARFVAGFGNNGGEEYLSYLLISETLSQKRGDEWTKWDGAITQLVEKVQNADGSWVGHHCITGRTFNTAAALLVLMGDRTPVAQKLIAK